MFVEQLSLLQEFLKANRMTHTLEVLRQELSQKIPHKPSNQILDLIDSSKIEQQASKQQISKKKKSELLADGLLGRIAYSSKILEDQKVNERITGLLENKIFQKAVGKMFPETISRMKQMHGEETHDELEMTVGMHSDGPSAIDPLQEEASIISQPSYILEELQNKSKEGDQYLDDNDLGYHQFDFLEKELMAGCSKLTQQYGYPNSAVKAGARTVVPPSNKSKTKRKFESDVMFPQSDDKIYPLQYNGVIFDTMSIQVVFDRQKTGFQDSNELELKVGDLLMGRYEVMAIMGSGVFAKVIKVKDTKDGELTCFKVVSNNKDFIDQSFDEIKLLRLIKANCDPQANYLLNFQGAFYYKEHLLLQTDLLKDNLFVAYRKNPSFFSVPVIKQIAKQVLTALSTLHALSIIHSDLKPQNILIKSYSPVEVKIVDFGNSCFTHDTLGTYVQSRSYRAPEVILGNGYDVKIDVWSLGCILAELWTKNVLFYNVHLAGMLARIQSILGAWPEWMLENGSKVQDFFSKENLIFYEEDGLYHILIPKKTSLKQRIRSDDKQFLNFLKVLLEIDPDLRPSAQQALSHPFLQ